ncbi:MAG TPA: acyloxyacyl hydrolase [Hyphomonadaceae bacterium]|nr:acyloxyacyl hydrolase [Hyphomonadaceae bacterium]
MRLGLAAAAAAVIGAPVALAPEASAQVDSVRLGVMKHNICVTDCKNANKESGVNIDGELRFASPDFLKWAFGPHPYVMGSVNTDGNTSFGGVGLEWDLNFAGKWHFEPGFGYIIHDGSVQNKYPSGTQAAVDYSADHVLLGSRDLFRTNLSLTYDLSETWAIQGMYEHLSHGQILGHGRNQGLDEIGVRLVWNLK